MPKMTKAQAKATDSAESQSFGPLDPGVYIGQLSEVEVKEGAKGPYWSWVFDDLTDSDGTAASGKLWVNTSLSPNAAWKMKEIFEAFGYTTDSDTDEMVGDRIKLAVSQVVIESGTRKGQLGNNVDRCMPLDGEAGDGEAATEDDEVF